MKLRLDKPWQIAKGDVLAVLGRIADNSVHTIVTSPPYWGLRDYGLIARVWDAKKGCKHRWLTERVSQELRRGVNLAKSKASTRGGAVKAARVGWRKFTRGQCIHCGAWRGSYGLEPTPEMYIQHTVQIFRELRRVLRADGTMWLNIGDSMANDGKWGGLTGGKQAYLDPKDPMRVGREKRKTNLKPKDMVGIPWRVALALQADGWWLRQEIIWHKPNSMPESVRDRCTTSHERIFLMAKRELYFYDNEAIKEPTTGGAHDRGEGVNPKAAKKEGENSRVNLDRDPAHAAYPKSKQNESFSEAVRQLVQMRNKRSVWTVATQAMDLELCGTCSAIYTGDQFRILPKRVNEDRRTERQCPSCLSWNCWISHFATFPEALVEPCVQASTSEVGCCKDCGAPWRRVASASGETKPVSGWDMEAGGSHRELTGRYSGHRRNARSRGQRMLDATQDARLAGGAHDSPFETKSITRWERTCKCKTLALVPAIVLDPFSGAGTVGVVSVRLGRKFVGIDLKHEYCALSRYRIENDRPLFNSNVEALTAKQENLFQ